MKESNVTIPFYVSTNNKHLECLRVFCEVFSKLWPNKELNILGYSLPNWKLKHNHNFISMGKQGPVNEWSTDLYNYFSTVKDPYFIYGTEDTFFYKPPNEEFINFLLAVIQQDISIGRINLVDGTEGDSGTLEESRHYKVNLLEVFKNLDWGDWKLYQQTPESNWGISTQFSIWNKDCFLKYMKPGRTPWEFEGYGSKDIVNDNIYKTLMVDGVFPIYKKEGYKAGVWENMSYWWEFSPKYKPTLYTLNTFSRGLV